jgi:acyl-CoA dehydrogenase
LKREAFGKKLIEQPVIRHRLAKCGALLESQQAWIEQFAYAMAKLTKAEADVRLGGLTALAKANSGIVLAACAESATLLFGGNGYTKTGQGQLIESMLFSNIAREHLKLTAVTRNIP